MKNSVLSETQTAEGDRYQQTYVINTLKISSQQSFTLTPTSSEYVKYFVPSIIQGFQKYSEYERTWKYQVTVNQDQLNVFCTSLNLLSFR